MRDWTAMELLKADGLVTLGAIARLTRADLCEFPSIGVQRADEVIDLLVRIGAAKESIEKSSPANPSEPGDPAFETDEWGDWDAPADFDYEPIRPGPVVLADGGVGDRNTNSSGTVAEYFPSLLAIQHVPLSDPILRHSDTEPADYLVPGWMARTGAKTVKDLLELTRQDFLNTRGLGPTKVSRLYEYLTRLADVAYTLAPPVAGEDEAPPSDFPTDMGGGSAARDRDERLDIITAWATSVAGARTWGDVLTAAGTAMPSDVANAWQELVEQPIDLGSPEYPLREFLKRDPRRERVLLARFASIEPVTLQELAAEFQVTRERIRQIESKALATMRDALTDSDDWRTVRWAVQRLSQLAGAYAPATIVANALPTWNAAERALVVRLADYEHSESVLKREGLVLPTASDLPLLGDTDLVIDEYALVEQLESLGVHPHFVDVALGSVNNIGRIDGQLVRWGGSIVDKAVAVLEVRDEPQDLEQLVIASYGDNSRSTRNRILEDPRIMRVTKNKVGLRRWGGSRYTGVAELMLERLASGPMELDELADELAKRYEVSTASVRMYAAAPAFKVSGDVVALRSRRDPFVARNTPWKVRGFYRDATSGVTLWSVVVDADMLRGSGRSVPQELASDLGVTPGERVDLQSFTGSVPLSWSERTHAGPQIGSIRELLDSTGVSLGENVVLRFIEAEQVLEAVAVDRVAPRSGVAAEIARRTGLSAASASSPAKIAESLGVEASELVAALEARGDLEISQLVGRLAGRAAGAAGPVMVGASSGVDDLAGVHVKAHFSPGTPNRASANTAGVVSQTVDGPRRATADPLNDRIAADRQELELEYADAVALALLQMRGAGYEPAALQKLVASVGPLKAGELLADLAEPTEAFVALYRLGRLDVSIEAQIAHERFRGLFSARLVQKATERLAQHGFEVN